jgi:hypothetical protein
VKTLVEAVPKPVTPRTISRVDIVGVPMDLGASRRGVDMGPSAVRYARLNDKLKRLGITDIRDVGNLTVPVPEELSQQNKSAKYFDVINAVCKDLAMTVERIVAEGGFPIVLGGDHSIAMGTLEGLTRARGPDSYGSTRTATSTAPIRRPPATCTECRSGSHSRTASPIPRGPCRSVFATSTRSKRRTCAFRAYAPLA